MPDILSISPLGGPEGSIVTIVLDSSCQPSSITSISLDSITAQKVDVGDNYISIVVPVGAKTNTINYSKGSQNFIGPLFIIGSPLISRVYDSIAPNHIATEIKASTDYWVEGSNFFTDQGSGRISVGQKDAVITTWSNTLIKIKTPSAPVTDGVIVFTDLGASNKFFLAGTDDSDTTLPVITVIDPTSVNTGATLAITGKSFGTTGKVFIGTVELTVTSWGNTSILAKVPTSARDGYVKVQNSVGNSNQKFVSVVSVDTTTVSVPVIRDAMAVGRAKKNYAKPGDTLTLTGSNFGNKIGDVTAPGGTSLQIVSWTDTAIKVIIPEGATTGNYTVNNEGGTVKSLPITIDTAPETNPNAKAYTVPTKTSTAIYDTYGIDLEQYNTSTSEGIRPFIKSMAEYAIIPGRPNTIFGMNFGSVAGQLFFGNSEVSNYIVGWTDREISFVPDDAITGASLQIFLLTETGSSNLVRVKATSGAPVIKSVFPQRDAKIGDVITIVGTSFMDGVSLQRNYVSVGTGQYSTIPRGNILEWSDNRIKFIALEQFLYMGTLRVVAEGVGSNAIEYEISGASTAPTASTSLIEIRNIHGQLVSVAGDQTSALLNELSNWKKVPNLNAQALDGKEWPEIQDIIVKAFDYEYQKDHQLKLAGVGHDRFGNINLVSGTGIKIVTDPVTSTVYIMPDWAKTANDAIRLGPVNSGGFCDIFGHCTESGTDGTADSSTAGIDLINWLAIDTDNRDTPVMESYPMTALGLNISISNDADSRRYGGNIFVVEPDFGPGEDQMVRGDHTHPVTQTYFENI